MKTQEKNLFGKGVRNLCDHARSWCGKLEAVSTTAQQDGLPPAAIRSLASIDNDEPRINRRGLTLWLINAIRELITTLLAEETCHREALAALPAARRRRDAAAKEVGRQLLVFRQLGLSDGGGALIRPGRLPRRPEEVAALAAAVRPRLDGPDLKLPPGVKILPTARKNLKQATAELDSATAAIDNAETASFEAHCVRNTTMADLGAHVDAVRSLHRALCDLRKLNHPERSPSCATR